MSLKRLIRREIESQKETIVGTVLKDPHLIDFGGSSGVWVVDVEIGGANYLKDVPVKAHRNRFYAQRGQTVLLRRNANGRYEVVAPGDRVATFVSEKEYTLETQVGGSATDFGFTFDRVPFSYYATLDGAAPHGVKWDDGVTPFNYVRIINAQGQVVG